MNRKKILEILIKCILFIFISFSVFRIIINEKSQYLIAWLRKTSLIFTKTPLKFSSISLVAEKKYGNYV